MTRSTHFLKLMLGRDGESVDIFFKYYLMTRSTHFFKINTYISLVEMVSRWIFKKTLFNDTFNTFLKLILISAW